MCHFYLTTPQREAVEACLGGRSLSAYAASAVLREAVQRGSIFYGDVEGGACARAAPSREHRCATGEPASWWNRHARAFFCAPCAALLNELEPGTCLPPESLPASAPSPPPLPGT